MADLLFRELSEKQEATIETKDFDSEISKEFSLSADSTTLPAEEGAGAWTVSTKTRRLAPAFTLSRKDLGTDSPRNIAAVQELAAAKKRGETWTIYRPRLSPMRIYCSVMARCCNEFTSSGLCFRQSSESIDLSEGTSYFRLS